MAKIRATLDANRGDVLIEGEDLTDDEILGALRARFPDEQDYRRERGQLAVTHDSGVVMRPFRFIDDEPRVVDRTVYL